jgi:hypothetical protein
VHFAAVNFPNTAALPVIVTFPTLKTPAANSMQIGEVELLATWDQRGEEGKVIDHHRMAGQENVVRSQPIS